MDKDAALLKQLKLRGEELVEDGDGFKVRKVVYFLRKNGTKLNDEIEFLPLTVAQRLKLSNLPQKKHKARAMARALLKMRIPLVASPEDMFPVVGHKK